MTETRPDTPDAPGAPAASTASAAAPASRGRTRLLRGATPSRRAPRPSRAARVPGTMRARLAPRPAADAPTTVLSSAFAMLALVSLWALAQLLVLGNLAEQRDQTLLYRELRGQIAAATAPLGPVTPPGDPVALLRIPAIGLEQVVVEGTASGDTLAGPGHLRSSVLPGQAGTSYVLGRATTYGAPFAYLTDLRVGDPITVVTGQGTTTYSVLGVRRAGDPEPQPLAAGSGRLTLVTAEGSGRLASLRPGDAVFVDAETTKPFPAPAGLPAAVPDSELLMATDPSSLPLLALELAALLALALGVVAARRRWSAVQVWTVATPLVLALAWATTQTAVRLLPNVM